jgi:hypothetical protein
MRHSSYPLRIDLRTRLLESRIDPDTTVVADVYGLDPIGVEVGILVTADERIIKFRYSADFDEWKDVSDTWREDSSTAEHIESELLEVHAAEDSTAAGS